uniref:Uncharacterized protein LOC111113913 n=1 Tax=Crassostrea virginica TaxID=6565 RepID=A0A8B8BX07_CRAVI|nr:uncharacterized protein LOC111113913 [Crassostrea virginica]
MSTVPVFDSQDTINETQSQDLFERDPPVREEDSTLVPNGILRDILKELKDIRTKMDALQSFSNGPPTTTCSFRVEDQNFKRECKRHIGDDPYKFKTMCSYASHKFTQMRNQLRRQIFHSTLDVQGLSLDGLSSFLFKAFIPPGQSPLDDQVRRMTVVIRAFLSQKKFQEGEKFWVELKAFYDTVILDQRSNIIDLLTDREERRIRRYVEADSPAPVADLGVWQDNVCLQCSVQPPEEERNGLTSPDLYKENKRPESPEIEIS